MKTLNIADCRSTVGYVNALDPKTYMTRTGQRLPRYRVRNNLLGNINFCPVVRKTTTLKRYTWQALRDRANDMVQSYDAETVARAINYLYTKETRSSFAIEHEEPSQTKMARFGEVLQSTRLFSCINKQTLLDLQCIILDERIAAADYRTEQNYVGETLGRREVFHFIAPKPEDVDSLMQGLLALLANSNDVDPVVVAATASFGFVFIHPFDDGNGRTHRYLIHHILRNREVTPAAVIFPVSATMLNQKHHYDACLESFSESIKPLIDFISKDDASIEVLNETVNLYRYFDATTMVEYLYDCIDKTIDSELKVELETVSAFASARKVLDATFDLPEKQKNLFLKLCWQGGGELSKVKRKSHFATFSDQEINKMQQLVAPYFAVPAIENE